MKYVLGHRNPDTDSVVSAVAAAELLGAGYAGARSGGLNKETIYLFERLGVVAPELPQTDQAESFVLVDHNQESQMPEGVDRAKIERIIDHHNLGGLSLPAPIPVLIEPFGCTATIIFRMFKEAEKTVSRETAGLLLGAVLSDTVKFKSPTTTDADRMAAAELAQLSGLDIDELAGGMFKAKSDLAGVTEADLINADYKNFQMGAKKVGIGVYETVDPEPALLRKPTLLVELENTKTKEGVDYLFFGVVDIVKEETYLLLLSESEKRIAEAVFGGRSEDQFLLLPGVVSRKKQMVPPLENYFANV